MTARISRDRDQGGVIYATGNENSGFSVFVQDDRLVVDYNAFDDHTILTSEAEVPVGDVELFVLSRDDVLCALKDHPEAEVGQTATNNMLATVKPRNAGSAGTEFELKSS